MRFISLLAAAAALPALGLTPAVAGSAPAAYASTGAARAARPQIPGGARLWQVRYDGGPRRIAAASSVAVSPDGSTVYVAGVTARAGTLETPPNSRILTVAYDAATGTVRWRAVYEQKTHHPGGRTFLAVSPDGTQVFLEASAPQPGQARFAEYLTLAYNAATGTQEWANTSLAEHQATGQALAVSPDGSQVYVTGLGASGFGVAYHTLALSAATGSQLWAADYPFRRNSDETTSYIAASGSDVFVVGQAGVVAYDAATGAQLWTVPYRLVWERRFQSLAVSPDGSRLFVTGKDAKGPGNGYVTAAYNTATGARRWQASVTGAELSQASSVTVSPDGATVFVTGDLQRSVVTTIAYDAATGAQRWASRYAGLKGVGAHAFQVAVSPDGSNVYAMGNTTVAGQSAYLVIAYSATAGSRQWVSRLAGPGGDPDIPAAMAVSGSGVFVTGFNDIPPSGQDQSEFATVAFQP